MSGDELRDLLSYKRREIDAVLDGHDWAYPLKVKVFGTGGDTKYLGATLSQATTIREILSGGSFNDIVAALAGER